jgi:glucose-6-phosphate 1-dehydrogenase
VIINIATLRWANQIFEPTWNAQHIESVQLTFKEDLGTGGRGGYFDGFGIIRDIIQNHLLQAFMWLAMEPPSSMTGAAITQSKVDLLNKVRTLSLDDAQSVFLGQFGRHGDDSGYLEDETVPAGSRCATFASLVLSVDSDRWRGVPFLFTAGKGMDERVCEIRIRYKAQPSNAMMGVSSQNELVLRVQPDEAVYMVTVAKEPGITAEQVRKPTVMDMSYATQFKSAYVGDAYERMFLNAARGDQALFVSSAELVEAWRIFTPLLHQIDERTPQPVVHPFGALPEGYAAWARANGIELRATWQEFVVTRGAEVDQLRAIFAQVDQDADGKLSIAEVTELARRFYDGREPPAKRVHNLFQMLDEDGDGAITFEEFLKGVQSMHRTFHPDENADMSSLTDRENSFGAD